MAEFETTCPHCGTALSAEDDWIGTEVECPVCKKIFVIARPRAIRKFGGNVSSFKQFNAGNPAIGMPPPFTTMNPQAQFPQGAMLTPASAGNKTWTALVLWHMLWPGLGHVYLGEKNKGIKYAVFVLVMMIASCLLALIPGIGALIGRIIFLCSCGIIIGESFVTLAALQMGGAVDRDQWIPRSRQKEIISSMPAELKGKWIKALAAVIAALLLGLTGPGILGWIAVIAMFACR